MSLVDVNTYEVQTHGIWSSHFAEAGKRQNAAYDVSGATVNQHAVWWLWPNTCLLRYPLLAGHAQATAGRDVHDRVAAGGLAAFCERYSDSFNRWWDDLGEPHLDRATSERLVDGLKSITDAHSVDTLTAHRDALLTAIIAATHGHGTPDRSTG